MKLLAQIIKLCFGENIMTELSFIKKYYYLSFKVKENNKLPYVIYTLDGKTFQCGFADRLRGIITTYAYAKANNLEFRIDHEVPFRIQSFYSPNQVNWEIRDNEKSYNLLQASPVVMLDYTKGKRLPYLSKHRQHHFYSNINAIDFINQHYGTSYTYHGLFNELFKPSDTLIEAVEPFKTYVEEGYISISFRFLQLMGDFKDVCGKTLPEQEQELLINKCLDFIEEIHNNNPGVPYVLVTSDSEKFQARAAKLDNVFIIPGKIGHIGYCSSDDAHLKTMLDFYMISQAHKAYMGYTGDMYKSHFAESAAETTGISYEAVKF